MLKEAVPYEIRKQRRTARRAKFIALLGGKCVHCGSKENLHFDHKKKKDKTLDIAHSIDTKEEILLNEIKKCQLLCKNCHINKTKEDWDFGVPKPEHGTIWMYKKYKCRCDKCKMAMSKYYYTQKGLSDTIAECIDLLKGLRSRG